MNAPQIRRNRVTRFGFDGELKQRVAALYAAMFAVTVGLALWAFIAFHEQPALLATALLAYVLGLRHAVDPDHIAAIDNVTRKLMQEAQRPIAVGFWFALGHSSMVVLASVAIALVAASLQARFTAYRETAAIIGTSVSAGFLLLIALFNLSILRDLWRHLLRVRSGDAEESALFSSPGGLLSRALRRLFKMISQSWHMFPLGLLFALGFDTASEIALFGLSASEAVRAMSLSTMLIFPLLFTAGMTLVDTTDGVLMLGAYHWAYVDARRKLFYNLTITAISVVVALVIGTIEGLGLLAEKFELAGPLWNWVADANAHFGMLGFAIVGIFIAAWALSALVHRYLVRDLSPALHPMAPGSGKDAADPASPS